jgi:hypothetical protein
MAVIMNCVPETVAHDGTVTQPASMNSRPIIGGRHVDVPGGIGTVVALHRVNHRDLCAGITAAWQGWQSSRDSVMAGTTCAPHRAM